MADYATLLRDLVTLTCQSVDRIFLQAYVPKLQSMGEVCQFLHWQKGFGIPSSAAFGTIAITAITRGSPKRSAGACWPSMIDGRVTSVKVATSGAGRAWAARRVAQTLVGFFANRPKGLRHRRVHPPARRVRESHPRPARGHPARPALHQPASHLRSEAAQTQKPHHSAIGTSPLPTHPTGQTRCRPVHQDLRTGPGPRPCRP